MWLKVVGGCDHYQTDAVERDGVGMYAAYEVEEFYVGSVYDILLE